DQMTAPWDRGIKVRRRIFPPPDLTALPIAAEHEIEIPIPVDVEGGAAGFDRQKRRLDDDPCPRRARPAIPDQSGRDLTKADDEVGDAVPIEIGDECAGLLGRGAR